MPPIPNPTLGADAELKRDVREVVGALKEFLTVFKESSLYSDRVKRSMTDISGAAEETKRSMKEAFSASAADRALRVGSKNRDNARAVALEHMKVSAELKKQEREMQALKRQHDAAGRSLKDWLDKWKTGKDDVGKFDAKVVDLQKHIDGLQTKANRLAAALPGRQGVGGALLERVVGPRAFSKIQEHVEIPRHAGVGKAFGAASRGAWSWARNELPATAGGAVAGLVGGFVATQALRLVKDIGKGLYDMGRYSILLNHQFDTLVDRSGEVNRSLSDAMTTLGLGPAEAAQFVTELQQAGIHSTEVAVVSKDMLVTQRALNVSLETQVRLFKLVSREVYGSQVGMVEAERRTQNMVRVAALLGQQLRNFTVDEMLEGTEQMARHVKGITADVDALPAKFVMISTAAGLAALGLAKARDITDDMAKGVGKMVLGLQDAPLDQQLFGTMTAFPGTSMDEQMALIHDLQSGKMTARGDNQGLTDMLSMVFGGPQSMMSQMLAARPDLMAGIKNGSERDLSTASGYVSNVVGKMPGMGEFASQNRPAFMMLMDKLVKSTAEGQPLVDGKGGGGLKDALDQMLDNGDLDQKQYDELLNLGEMKTIDKKILDSAEKIAMAQDPIRTSLGLLAARALGAGPEGIMKMVFGANMTSKEISAAMDAGVQNPADFRKYRDLMDAMAPVASAEAESEIPLNVNDRARKVNQRIQQKTSFSKPDGSFDQDKFEKTYAKYFPTPSTTGPDVYGPPLSLAPQNAAGLGEYIRSVEMRKSRGGRKLPATVATDYAAKMIEASRIVESATGFHVDPKALAVTAALESDYKENAARYEPNGSHSFGLTQVLDRTWDAWRANPKVPLEQMGIPRNLNLEQVMSNPQWAFTLGAYHMAERGKAGQDPIGSYVSSTDKGAGPDQRRRDFDALTPGQVRVWTKDGISVDIVVGNAPTPAQNIKQAGGIAIPGTSLTSMPAHQRGGP